MPIAAAGYSSDAQVGATVAYALMYAVVNLGAFAVAALVARTKPLNRIADYRGLYAERPFAALALGFFLLCLAGLPPGIIGLFAKVTVFSAAVDAGLGWLAVVMAFNVVIALYYYLRWTAVLFRAPEEAEAALAETASSEGGAEAPGTGAVGVLTARPVRVAVPAPLTLAIALTALAAVALSVMPQIALHFASISLF